MTRREFSNRIKAEIVRRATNERDQICCEGCGLALGKKAHHIDHTIPDALYRDKSRALTAADGKLLGWDCCHKPKTAIDQADIARAVRREAKNAGIRRSSRPMAGSKASGLKKRMDGTVERRETT